MIKVAIVGLKRVGVNTRGLKLDEVKRNVSLVEDAHVCHVPRLSGGGQIDDESPLWNKTEEESLLQPGKEEVTATRIIPCGMERDPKQSSNLLVAEAKRSGEASGEAQLLAYMRMVLIARRKERRENTTVYGLLTDSHTITFFCLQSGRRYTKKVLLWGQGERQQDEIVSLRAKVMREAALTSPKSSEATEDTSDLRMEGMDTRDSPPASAGILFISTSSHDQKILSNSLVRLRIYTVLIMSAYSDLPNKTPGLSYWQRTTRGFPSLHANRDDSVPSTAKYVIIGSGLSGALTAFELLEAGVPGDEVVILEAREAASGATSRNAGHVRPDAFRGFPAYSRIHGEEQALKVIANERLVLERVDEFVQRQNVPCDFHLTTTFDVCMSEEFAENAADSLRAYAAAGGDVSHIVQYTDGEIVETKTKVKGAVGAYEWPAASIHPAKLTQFLLQSVVDRKVRLFTFCPATEISKRMDTNIFLQQWDIHTPRGTITAEKIIHCTNAHAGALLSMVKKHILPNRAQAHSLIPTPSFSATNKLTSTLSLRYGLYHFYSLIQRQEGDGTLILGASRVNPTLSPETIASRLSSDDSTFNQEILDDALRSFQEIFPQYGLDTAMHGEGLDHVWTGIIAMTPDSVPFIGAIDSLPGQYICAGFNGHGTLFYSISPLFVLLLSGRNGSHLHLRPWSCQAGPRSGMEFYRPPRVFSADCPETGEVK
ncbi:hypothetical protein ASPZODRAFT_168187 [Penicilliopsis zonata CBS 506.65]|uniref:FAD dependent oxidoreductase domain-containing protein n=1 Tax=Penicilliopsis zonata CBS 506.65 TaxID=1073090 RepID=A0A1L9SDD9_9EURO|nr:hypothetical protein ASPZODRAFT_168187 [Penicilliopsis zonata CBS 506.65]OJJ45107.1 hypothetical protein ASPZODRAFT_168187 [Penicilliopsis zonata CBS 506.65]